MKRLNIEMYDNQRVLIYDSKGLGRGAVNLIKSLARKEHWNDVNFAEFDDGRMAIVCYPKTWINIMQWNTRNSDIRYPVELEKWFMDKCNEVLHDKNTEVQKFSEADTLTKKESEVKKKAHEEIKKMDESGEEVKGKEWEEEKL